MSDPAIMLLAALAGGVGATARYLVDRAITSRVARRRSGAVYPWGTIAVNLSGSFLVGILTGLFMGPLVAVPAELSLAATVGLLGGYTTFSTASYDTIRLFRRGRIGAGLVNSIGQLCAATLAAGLGFWLGGLFGG